VPRGLFRASKEVFFAGNPVSFSDLGEEDKKRCIPLTDEQMSQIAAGSPLESVVPPAAGMDLVLHSHVHVLVNTKARQAVWVVGYQDVVHPGHKHVLLFAPGYQNPQISGSPFVYEFVLGTEVPISFRDVPPTKTRNFGFVCANQRPQIQSAELAQYCREKKIRCIFAGPITQGYEETFMSQIDRENTVYIGEISTVVKRTLNADARCVFQLHTNPTCATLASKEAMAVGTPTIATPVGEWPAYIVEGVNGYLVQSLDQLEDRFGACSNIHPADCFVTAKFYSHQRMVQSLARCISQIMVD
jgi:hypothetical protein